VHPIRDVLSSVDAREVVARHWIIVSDADRPCTLPDSVQLSLPPLVNEESPKLLRSRVTGTLSVKLFIEPRGIGIGR